MADAMRLVREELGPDAIIVDQRKNPKGAGILVTAALDEGNAIEEALERDLEAQQQPRVRPETMAQVEGAAAEAREAEDSDLIADALAYHGVPDRLADKLVWDASHAPEGEDWERLAHAIDSNFRFSDIPIAPKDALIVIGPQGSGKTVTIAKLATRVKLAGKKAFLATTDTVRAGGVGQLSSFTDLLEQPLVQCDSAKAFQQALTDRGKGRAMFIDTPGVNAFNDEELKRITALAHMAQASDETKCRFILCMPAGMDAMEAAEAAEVFRRFRPTHIIVTRLDTARRLGSLLAAAWASGAAFSLVSLTAFVSNGLTPIDAGGMARLLLRDPTISDISKQLQKAGT